MESSRDRRHGLLFLHYLLKYFEFFYGLRQHILVRHGHHRHVAAKPLADFLRAIACGVDHVLTADVALFSLNHPLVAFTACAGGGV